MSRFISSILLNFLSVFSTAELTLIMKFLNINIITVRIEETDAITIVINIPVSSESWESLLDPEVSSPIE